MLLRRNWKSRNCLLFYNFCCFSIEQSDDFSRGRPFPWKLLDPRSENPQRGVPCAFLPVFWQRGAVGKAETSQPQADPVGGDGGASSSSPASDLRGLLDVNLAQLASSLRAQSDAYGRSRADAERYAQAVLPQMGDGDPDLAASHIGFQLDSQPGRAAALDSFGTQPDDLGTALGLMRLMSLLHRVPPQTGLRVLQPCRCACATRRRLTFKQPPPP